MFESASAIRADGQGRFVFDVDPSWFQGRGSFGGLTAAVVLRAMQALAPEKAARAFTIQLCAPVPAGPNVIEATVERAGSSMTFLSARVIRDGAVCASAQGAFGRDRATDLDFDACIAPQIPALAPEQLPSAPPPSSPLPAFLQHFRMAFVLGSLPYAGAAQAHVGAWVRTQQPEIVDVPLAAALLDALPPALLVKAPSLRAMSSVSISYHFMAPLPDPTCDPVKPMLVDVHAQIARGGYSDQTGRLYSPAGRLVAVARQVVAVLQ